jgi:hypothetical protein
MEPTLQNDLAKPIVKPRTWNPRDVYLAFAEHLLATNPGIWQELKVINYRRKNADGSLTNVYKNKRVLVGGYWSQYSKQRKMRHFRIFTKVDGKIIEVINFERWKQIMENFFKSARRYIIDGETLNMENYVGKIAARRVERNFKNKQVDFAATRQRPRVMDDNGKLRPDIVVYHVDDDWIRIGWAKTGKITNETAYKFAPCTGDKDRDGFKQQFSKSNKSNKALKFNYQFSPFLKQQPLKPGT